MSKTYTSQLDLGVCACMSARVYVCIRASVRPSGFFQAIISTFMDKFQNDLAWSFSLLSRSSFGNICSGR